MRLRVYHSGGEFGFYLDFARSSSLSELSPALAAEVQAGKHQKALFRLAQSIKDIAWEIKEQRPFLHANLEFFKQLVEEKALQYLGLQIRGQLILEPIAEQREIDFKIRKAQEDLLSPPSTRSKTLEEVIHSFQVECVEKWLGDRFPEIRDLPSKVLVRLKTKVAVNLAWTQGKGAGRRNTAIPELTDVLERVQDPLIQRKIRQVLKNLHKELMTCRHFRDHAKRHHIILAEQYHPTLIDKYIRERLNTGISSESLKSEMQIIERLWDYAEKNDFIVKNRIRGVRVGERVGHRNIKTDRATLTMRDAMVLLWHFNRRIEYGEPEAAEFWREALYVYLTLLLTGCRPSELNPALRYEPKPGLICFNPLERGRQVVGKTASSVRLVKLQPGGTLDLIFRNRLIEGWYGSNVAERFQGFLDRLKRDEASRDDSYLKNLTVKSLRKTCATWRHALGHDKRVVAEEMGHSQLVAESHYVDKFEALRVIGFEQKTAKKAWEWFNNCLVRDPATGLFQVREEIPEWFEISTREMLERERETAHRTRPDKRRVAVG